MDRKVLKTKTQYQAAVARLTEIFHAEAGTPEADELDLLLELVKEHEDKHIWLTDFDQK